MLFNTAISPETYAVIRFGMGFPARATPLSAEAMLDRLAGPDVIAAEIPFFPFQATNDLAMNLRNAGRNMDNAMGENPVRAARQAIEEQRTRNLLEELARAVQTEDPFRERLHSFWFNHFTAAATSRHLRTGRSGYAAEAIRPHLNGRFADMLKAVATHPFMLFYLDQRVSIGPNSTLGLKNDKGLNENYARELLELHTVGVDAAYGQGDVRQLAELLTGLSADFKRGFRFRDGWVEPGAETVLGKTYGGNDVAPLDAIHAVLEDLAVHPATAAHLCHKLARHFIADVPDADLVAHMTAAYRRSGGALSQVYAAMLEHPAAWTGFGAKAKRPFEFMATALRAVGASAEDLLGMRLKSANKALRRPLARMGQPYDTPPGPDGWSDTASDWITAHGIAGRISWSLSLARLLKHLQHDPRPFVYTALGDAAGDRLRFAATAAESKPVGVALILASAEFNRR